MMKYIELSASIFLVHFDGEPSPTLVLLFDPHSLIVLLMNLLPDSLIRNKMSMFFDFVVDVIDLLDFGEFHSIFPEAVFPAFADVSNFFHGFDGVDVDVSVVHLGLVDLAFQFEDGVLDQFFVVLLSIGFGPLEFSGIVFGLEMLVALGPAKAEGLAVIPDKHHAVAGVNRSRAEVAFLDPHFNNED